MKPKKPKANRPAQSLSRQLKMPASDAVDLHKSLSNLNDRSNYTEVDWERDFGITEEERHLLAIEHEAYLALINSGLPRSLRRRLIKADWTCRHPAKAYDLINTPKFKKFVFPKE